MVVYLIHFDRPLCHARHYLGFASDLERRIEQHRAGNGARLLAAANAAGIGWRVVRVWEGKGRTFERRLKNRKNAGKQLCPVCRAEHKSESPSWNAARVSGSRPTATAPDGG